MRLSYLADHLDYRLAERLRDLIAADSMAHRVDDLVQRAERAEALAAECQRQLRSLDRQLQRVRDELLTTDDEHALFNAGISAGAIGTWIALYQRGLIRTPGERA